MKYFVPLFILLLAYSVNLSAQEKKSYIVKEGETLYAISKVLEVSVAELQEWNNIDDSGISIGQELVYYVKEEEELPTEPAKSLVDISNPAENTFYIVKSGDNLYTIARYHNMTLEELQSLNELTSDVLRIGQKLSVKKISVAPSVSEFSEESSPQGSFAVYTVERGQSLSDILTKFKMTERELQELNPEISVVALDRGQQITVLLPPSRSYDNPYLNNATLQDLGTVGASLYNNDELGNATTNGELYNPEELTAAHSNIALGSIIFIENPETKNGIYVRINDRITDSGLKLSAKAFRILELENSGNPTVTIYTDS